MISPALQSLIDDVDTDVLGNMPADFTLKTLQTLALGAYSMGFEDAIGKPPGIEEELYSEGYTDGYDAGYEDGLGGQYDSALRAKKISHDV